MRADLAPVDLASETARRVQEDQNRADFMEFLYEIDERGNPDHPYRYTYTGLFQQYALAAGTAALKDIAKEWHTYEQSAVAGALGQEAAHACVGA